MRVFEDSVHSALRRLQDYGKRFVGTEQQARQVRSSLQEVLINDEDMAMINADVIAEWASSLLGEDNHMVDTIQSVFDIRNNEIMTLKRAQLKTWMLGFAVSTFVTGLFGINVIISFEESYPAFAQLASGCTVETIGVARVGMRKLAKFRRSQL
ncbi:Magnesium transporter MRS2/LPE10 [Penicillium argentinense]|uniref:Magnesium transporter MRS2/LPE10 n=1 Tax=Penicillium argentinense TaxID=1131581 RepID=A0A9W9K2R8_9EURO|nr:Magnesium transporter MRS2/LPE10 [Penicillium argentinense]KAJ5090989.1 Magnesium transporter MRS2/LPE10 [Penicillium argentinense]